MHALTYISNYERDHSQIIEMIYRPEIHTSYPVSNLWHFWLLVLCVVMNSHFCWMWEWSCQMLVSDRLRWKHDTTRIKNRSPSLKTLLLIHSGGDRMSCSSVAKTQSVSNYSKITAWDSSAYPSVTIQRVIFSCLSHSGSTSNLKRVFVCVCVCVCVCVTTIHGKVLHTGFMLRENVAQPKPQIFPPHIITLFLLPEWFQFDVTEY